jgi:hypothetical protein
VSCTSKCESSERGRWRFYGNPLMADNQHHHLPFLRVQMLLKCCSRYRRHLITQTGNSAQKCKAMACVSHACLIFANCVHIAASKRIAKLFATHTQNNVPRGKRMNLLNSLCRLQQILNNIDSRNKLLSSGKLPRNRITKKYISGNYTVRSK